jgi:endonuclease/exonuclease/phosphatase (EEP) superfamily protein YafD
MSDEAPHDPHASKHRKKRISKEEKMLLERIREHERLEKKQPAQAREPREDDEEQGPFEAPMAPTPVRAAKPDRSPFASEPPPQRRHSTGTVADFFAHPLVKGALRLLRLAVRLTVLLYLIGLACVALSIDHFGQANVTTATLMYLPSPIWLLPGIALLLPALIFDWKSFLLLLFGGGFFFTSHLNYQWRSERSLEAPEPFEKLRLLSWNRGQSGSTSLSTLKADLKPDFILLQDARGRAARYRLDANYREFREFVDTGEFAMISRWPVLASENLTMNGNNGAVITVGAARFVTVYAGTKVVLYSIHLPSPRDALEATGRGAFLLGILGLPGTSLETKKLHYQAFWDGQMLKAAEILRRIRQETDPVIIAGDFNTPAVGPVYKLYADTFQDAHLQAGSGFGHTFPGDTRNPLALFQPWLRLDQMFASQDWQVLNCQAQAAKAQHLPVFGIFKLHNKQPAAGGPLLDTPQ